MEYKSISLDNREQINAFIEEHWLTTQMIIRGEVVDMTKVDGVVVYENDAIIGLMTYMVKENVCEITSLDSLSERRGIGTSLIEWAIDIARGNRCSRVIVVTTNDNIHAIRFYQRRGFDMARLYHNALDVSRRLKPEIPMIGEEGIPLRHEIEFEYRL